MAAVAELDPMEFQVLLCQRPFQYPRDLQLLNEMPCFCMIYDLWEKNNAKRLWANASWLKYVGQTLEEFQAYDFAGNTSAQIKSKQFDLGQDIQARRQRVNFEFTMYPNEEPLRVTLLHQPILFEGWDHAGCLALIYPGKDELPENITNPAPPLSFHFDGEMSVEGYDFPRAFELLNEVPCFSLILDFSEVQKPKQLWANAAWLTRTACTLEDFKAAEFAEILSPCVQERAERLRQEVQEARQTYSYQTIVHPAGQPLRVRLVFRPIVFEGESRPKVLCAVVPADDQTEVQLPKPKAQDAETNARHLFKELAFTLLTEGVMLFDFQAGSRMEALWASYAGRTMYGLTFDSRNLLTQQGAPLSVQYVLDNCIWQNAHEKDVVHRRLKKLRVGSEPVVITCRKADPSERPNVWHQLRFAPCKNPYTGGECLLLQESDVTDLMLAQAALQASNDFKDKFLQCISHELRTPLHGIQGLSSALSASPDCTPRMKAALATIDSSAKKLNGLVTDMLETAEIMAGNFQLSMDPVNLADICERVCDAIIPRVRRGVQLVNSISGIGMVEADSARLFKVLTHLIDNAVKFTFRGHVEVRAMVLGEEDCQFVRVDVCDTGCGIKKEQLGSIWEHFQQGDMSDTRDHSGTGLGLTLVKQLVHAHGGQVGVVSSRNEGGHGGTTFSFTLPMTRDQRLDAAAASIRDIMSLTRAEPSKPDDRAEQSRAALSSDSTAPALSPLSSTGSAGDVLSPLSSPLVPGKAAMERRKKQRWSSGSSKREMFVSTMRNLNAGIEEGCEEEIEEERAKVRQLEKTVQGLEERLEAMGEQMKLKDAALEALECRIREMEEEACEAARDLAARVQEHTEQRQAGEEERRRQDAAERGQREEIARLELLVARLPQEHPLSSHALAATHPATSCSTSHPADEKSGQGGAQARGDAAEPEKEVSDRSAVRELSEEAHEMREERLQVALAQARLQVEGVERQLEQLQMARGSNVPSAGRVAQHQHSPGADMEEGCGQWQRLHSGSSTESAWGEEWKEDAPRGAGCEGSEEGECASCHRAQKQLARAVKALHAARQGLLGKHFQDMIQSTAFVRAASADSLASPNAVVGGGGLDFVRVGSVNCLARPTRIPWAD